VNTTVTDEQLVAAEVAEMPSFPIERSEMRLMPTGQLQIDKGYQRGLDERRAERLARSWSSLKAQVLIVSARMDGSFFVIEGQHRLSAARIARVPSLYCLLLWGLSREQEAELFEVYNAERVGVHIIDRFKAALVAKDKTALAIQKALGAQDMQISFKPDPQSTSAVAALETLYAWGALPVALDIITSAWPDDKFSRSRAWLLAIGSLDVNYREDGMDEERIISILRNRSPKLMLEDASAKAEYTVGRRKTWAVVAEEIVRAYNRGLPAGQKLPPYDAPEIPSKQLRFSKDRDMPWGRNRKKPEPAQGKLL
jgi:hypothetical protein